MATDPTYTPFTIYKNIESEPVPIVYKDIKPGLYSIYSNGTIINNKTGHILNHEIIWSGYHRVDLSCTGELGRKHAHFSVHILVGNAYLINPFPDDYTDIDHRDGSKDNNDYTNLRYCNNNQNKNFASMNGQYQHGEDRYNYVYTDFFCHEICKLFQDGISYIDVYNKYVTPENRSTMGSLIYKLYHRKTRREITSQYNY